MLEVYDSSLKKLAVLENAYDIIQTHTLNGVGSLTFTLPGADPKCGYCRPMAFARTPDGTFYRILTDTAEASASTAQTFECEHAIATLVDDILFGTHILGGQSTYTPDVLRTILAAQTTRHWQLDRCDFRFPYEYGFSSENLLNALFSVPRLFVDDYQWAFDMTAHPWRVSLRRIDRAASPRLHIRAGRNLIVQSATRLGQDICTRLYPLGYGEGDNQLTIRSVNGGIPYLESPPAILKKWGRISRVYVDRQFEDPESLLQRGRALLAAMQEPRYARRFKIADLYPLTGAAADHAQVGDLARLCEDGETVLVTTVKRWLDIDGEMEIEMSTHARDIAADLADIANRQRIEQTYAQGATQLYVVNAKENATPSVPAEQAFLIPGEMLHINRVTARITLSPFRTFSRTTSGGGRSTQTSSAGGGSVTSSASAGAASVTSAAGGSTTVSAAQTVTLDSGVGYTTDASSLSVTGDVHPSYTRLTGPAAGSTGLPTNAYTGSAGGTTGSGGGSATGLSSMSETGIEDGSGRHRHYMNHTHPTHSHTHPGPAHSHTITHTHGLGGHVHNMDGHRHNMSHTHTMWHQHRLPGHSHTLPAHSHQVNIPGHAHNVQIPGHTHSVTVPDHTHQITPGVFRSGSPTRAHLTLGGKPVLEMGKSATVDLTRYLVDGGTGKIPRDRWFTLGVLPDDLAYVTIDLTVQGFIQSRGGEVV